MVEANSTVSQGIRIIESGLEGYHDKIDNKSFLITGGAGFLGSWLCDVLISLGGAVVCVDNLSSGSKENIQGLEGKGDFELVLADVCDVNIRRKEVDYVIHMASLASPPLYQRHPIETLDANVLGTRNMLNTARRLDAKGFLYTSTSEVYGDASIFPTPESYWGNVNPVGPRSVYDEGKRVGETYCQAFFKEHLVPVRIARVFNTYGPRLDLTATAQYGRAVVKFIDQALREKPLTVYGDGSQTRSFCYVSDTIEALLRLLLSTGLDGCVVNIGSPDEISILQLAKLVIDLSHSSSKIILEPLPTDDPRRRRPDIALAERVLGWTPKVDLYQGLRLTIGWYKSHGYLHK